MSIWDKIFGPRKKIDPISPAGHEFIKDSEERYRLQKLEIAQSNREMAMKRPESHTWYKGEILRHGITADEFVRWTQHVEDCGFTILYNHDLDTYVIKNPHPTLKYQ